MDLIYELVNGHRRSKVLFAVVELGVVDALALVEASSGASGGLTAVQIAASLKHRDGDSSGGDGDDSGSAAPAACDPEALARLLDAAAALGLLRCCDSGGQARRYTLTGVSCQYLASQSPQSVAGYVIHSNRTVYPLFQHLEDSVWRGDNAWDVAFGMPGTQMFAALYRTPEAVQRFMRGMHGFAALSARDVLTAFDLSGFSNAVDLGGATGAFMYTLAQLQPSCRCTVVDLPHVISTAKHHFTKPPFMPDASVAARVEWLALDFFEALGSPIGPRRDAAAATAPATAAVLPSADLFVLTRILHDWAEDRCLALLAGLRRRMAPRSALLLGEMLLEDAAAAAGGSGGSGGAGAADVVPGPPNARLQDLNMLVQTQGRERSAAGYTELLSRAGFDASKVQARRTGSYLDAVIAYV